MVPLLPLPFSIDALEPRISSETVSYHYRKHQRGYVEKTNALISGRPDYSDLDLESIIRRSRENKDQKIFNNAAQVWNHQFYWECLVPEHSDQNEIKDLLKDSFESLDIFQREFFEIGTEHFGSGYLWLVKNPHTHLTAWMETSDAATPAASDLIPILTCDLWEHSYYIDYRNDRKKYLKSFWDLINWNAVKSRLLTETPDVKTASYRG